MVMTAFPHLAGFLLFQVGCFLVWLVFLLGWGFLQGGRGGGGLVLVFHWFGDINVCSSFSEFVKEGVAV